jgi:hypothetical protein
VEYASSIWDPYLKKDIHRLEMVQWMEVWFVCNKHQSTTSVDNMFTCSSHEWRTLEDRRRDTRLTKLYKISIYLVAINKTDRLVPPKGQTRNTHNTNISYQIPSTSSDYHKGSFFLHTIQKWNAYHRIL